MSNQAYAVSNDEVVTGYDTLAASSWCSPSFLGCSICVSAATTGDNTTITIQLNTPFGNLSKSFSFNSNICFTWQPFSKVKLQVCISDFSVGSNQVCFTFGANICVDVPFFGWKCSPQLSNQFCIPLPGHSLNDKLAANELSDQDFALALLLAHHAEDSGSCNCK